MTASPAPHASRRHFLAGTVAGFGGALAGGAASAQAPSQAVGGPEPKLDEKPPLPVAQRLGWAVMGLGDFTQQQVLPALGRARRSRLAALVSGNPEKASGVAARHGLGEQAIYGYEAIARMADNPDIAVVYVVTPNATHADLTIQALEAGKHVLCEKPMATNSADCQRMVDAARAARRHLMIAYRVHWEPHNLRAKAMMEAGEFGQVWFASSDHHRPMDLSNPRDAWRAKHALAGGGSLMDIGIYGLNGIQWFFGESPSSVSASMASPPGDPRFAEVENVLSAQLVFPSGRRATLSCGYSADKKRIDLWGDKAVATLDPGTAYKGNRLVVSNEKRAEEVLTRETDAVQFTGEIDHLSQVIQDGGQLLAPAEMGLRDIRIIEALYRAAREGRWIALNDDMTMKDA